MSERESRQHGATVMRGGGAAWATCLCGWKSRLHTTTIGASIAFAEHVKDAKETER
jgi:hypothetical protein